MTIVVGGHSRNIGKTSVVANLIRATQNLNWTAIKITQFGHSVCSHSGGSCGCAPTDPDHPFALTHETDPATGTDSSRYLAAGARESIWLRTRQGELGFAVPALHRILDRAQNTIIESNSVLQYFNPDLFLVVLDPAVPDFKPSTLRYLDRADAILYPASTSPCWPQVSLRLIKDKQAFHLGSNFSIPPGLASILTTKGAL